MRETPIPHGTKLSKPPLLRNVPFILIFLVAGEITEIRPNNCFMT